MSTDIKICKAQISKMIESGGFFDSWLGNLGKKAPTKTDVPLARDNLLGLVNNLASNPINRLEKELSEQEKYLRYLYLMKI